MRLASRILVVLGLATGPTVVVLFGCNVDIEKSLPGLPNELPNKSGGGRGVPSGTGSGSSSSGTGSSSSSTSSSSSGSAGAAQSPCDCADAFFNGSSTCVACESSMCNNAYVACMAGDCSPATVCVANCNDQGPCIAQCLTAFPDYAFFVNCLFTACAPSCGVATPLMCPLPSDAGADG